jgi:hypothetical protein
VRGLGLVILLMLTLLPGDAAGQGAQASVALAWNPERPEPDLVMDVPLDVTYTWTAPATTVASTRIAVRASPSETALNATVEPGELFHQPAPTGGTARLNATLHLRWLFRPTDATSARLALEADAEPNGNLPAAHTQETVIVLWPLRGIPEPAPPPQSPQRPAPGVDMALLLLGAAVLALARRR